MISQNNKVWSSIFVSCPRVSKRIRKIMKNSKSFVNGKIPDLLTNGSEWELYFAELISRMAVFCLITKQLKLLVEVELQIRIPCMKCEWRIE